jgi:hydroxyacylglutathione hydrolase
VSEPITPAAARDLAAREEVVLLDVRTSAEFARGHAPGAISVPFSQRGLARRVEAFAPGTAVVIIASVALTGEDASDQLHEAGISVRGVLEGGFAGWSAAGFPQRTIGEVAVDDLAHTPPGTTIVDVREPVEWATGHVPGALRISLGTLRAALPDVPRDRPIVTICEAGVRSSTAASILAAAGFTDVSHVPAGSSGYRKSGLPLAFPDAQEVEA